MSTLSKKQQGFTLLELLVVVAIMAIIAGMSLMSHKTTLSYSKDQAALAEMKQLAQAVRQYFMDQNVVEDGDGNPLQLSPADISFLTDPFFDPNNIDNDGNIKENLWSADYRTGWRGPYIKTGVGTTPFVSIADTSNTGLEFNGAGDPAGDGDPDTGTVIIVQAKPDPYSYPSTVDGFFIWRRESANVSVGNPEIPRLGRPYLFFDLETYGRPESRARIVSLGANGVYDIPAEIGCDLAVDDTDVNYCFREDVCESLGDDLVLCL